jgi:hypothetical protein
MNDLKGGRAESLITGAQDRDGLGSGELRPDLGTELRCCHGTSASGHSQTCPYDKEFWGPKGVDWSGVQAGRGINFHESTMALRHGPGSLYAQNLAERAALGKTSAPVEADTAKPARSKPSKRSEPETGSLF